MPKVIDKDEKRLHIMLNAIKVFALKGSAKTKMEDIAQASDVGKGTLYEYFSNKEEIFNLAFEYFTQEMDAVISRKLFRVFDPLEKLRTYCLSWIDLFDKEHTDYLEIMLDFWAEGIRSKGDASKFNLIKVYEENRKILFEILNECISQKKIRPVDINITSSLILGTLDGLLLQWILDREVFNLQNAVTVFTDILFRGLEAV